MAVPGTRYQGSKTWKEDGSDVLADPKPAPCTPSIPDAGAELTCHDENDPSGHGYPGLLHFVISPAVGALHAHGGHEHGQEAQHQGYHHQGSGGLQGRCGEGGRTPSLLHVRAAAASAGRGPLGAGALDGAGGSRPSRLRGLPAPPRPLPALGRARGSRVSTKPPGVGGRGDEASGS